MESPLGLGLLGLGKGVGLFPNLVGLGHYTWFVIYFINKDFGFMICVSGLLRPCAFVNETYGVEIYLIRLLTGCNQSRGYIYETKQRRDEKPMENHIWQIRLLRTMEGRVSSQLVSPF